MVLGAVVVVVRHSYHHACCCCGVFFRHRRRLLPLSLLCLSAPCFLVSNGKRTNQYILTSKGTFYTRVPAQRISCPTSLAHSHCSFFLGPTTWAHVQTVDLVLSLGFNGKRTTPINIFYTWFFFWGEISLKYEFFFWGSTPFSKAFSFWKT
jgi:hypothetical protein